MKSSVYIAVPMRLDGSPASPHAFLATTQIAIDSGSHLVPLLREPVACARNAAVSAFMGGAWSHLLFIDDDVIAPPDALTRMLALDSDIAVGVVPIVGGESIVGNVWRKENASDGQFWSGYVQLWPTGVFECDMAGTGCMLIKRHVFDRIGYPWFRWMEDPGSRRMVGEDLDFCQRAKNVGLRIVCDGAVRCGHEKRVDLRWIHAQTEKAKGGATTCA